MHNTQMEPLSLALHQRVNIFVVVHCAFEILHSVPFSLCSPIKHRSSAEFSRKLIKTRKVCSSSDTFNYSAELIKKIHRAAGFNYFSRKGSENVACLCFCVAAGTDFISNCGRTRRNFYTVAVCKI